MVQDRYGHDPGNATNCDLGTYPMSLTWLGHVGVGIELSGKADSPTALYPKWVAQSQVLDGTLRHNPTTFGISAKSASSEH